MEPESAKPGAARYHRLVGWSQRSIASAGANRELRTVKARGGHVLHSRARLAFRSASMHDLSRRLPHYRDLVAYWGSTARTCRSIAAIAVA